MAAIIFLLVHAAALDVRLKPASQSIPPGRVARWLWQGPGEVQLNASCQDGILDFYVVSGEEAELRRRRRLAPKERPDCEGCSAFAFTSALSSDGNVTMLLASNKEGQPVKLHFQESLLGVPSCMDRCFIRPWNFVGIAFLVALALGCGFRLARPLCRAGLDEAWAPRVLQCQRPAKPREVWRSWILHGCIMTYPWNPWHNDPLEYGLRCVVLMVSLGLTIFVSTLYGHLFTSWDSGVARWEDEEPGGPSVQGALLVSLLSSAVEGVLRLLALAVFRSSLACSRQKRWRVQAPALALAISVVLLCIGYPLALALSGHLCGYVRHLFAQFVVSQAIRGLPLAITATTLQFLALRCLGRTQPSDSEMAELNAAW